MDWLLRVGGSSKLSRPPQAGPWPSCAFRPPVYKFVFIYIQIVAIPFGIVNTRPRNRDKVSRPFGTGSPMPMQQAVQRYSAYQRLQFDYPAPRVVRISMNNGKMNTADAVMHRELAGVWRDV